MTKKGGLYFFCGSFILTLWLLQRQATIGLWWTGLSVLGGCFVLSGLFGFRLLQQGRYRGLFWFLAGSMAAIVLVSPQLYLRWADKLPLHEENGIFRVQLQVLGLPQVQARSVQFQARVLAARPLGVPKKILVRWQAPDWSGPYQQPVPHEFPVIRPGQLWQMTLVLRSPHGSLNPYGFDYEQFALAQDIRVIGTVRGRPRPLDSEQLWQDFRIAYQSPSLYLTAQQIRARLKEQMQPLLEAHRWGPVVAALTIGDRSDFSDEDWQLFNRAGLTHLISISGTHITLVAGSVGACLWWFLRYFPPARVLCEYQPAALLASLLALLVAAFYSAIAGWGVPARRSFFMLAVAVMTYIMRLRLPAPLVLLVVALVVLALDPWAILSTGFWLSFGAVAVLIACAHWSGQLGPALERTRARRAYQKFMQFVLWQVIITVLLWPMLAWFFAEFSLASVLSNLYAIPLLGTVGTPLSLLFALSSWIFGAHWLTELFLKLSLWSIEVTMRPTIWLVEQPWAALSAARAPWWVYLFCCLGLLVAVLPRFNVWQRLGWLTVLPVLFWPARDLAHGQWRIELLDVGQGLAVVIQTAQHNYLYDVGGRSSPEHDQGKRVILPHLQARGVHALDGIIISHADLDHIGGLRSIMQALPVQALYSSFPLLRWWHYESERLQVAFSPFSADYDLVYCRSGLEWEVDGVRFRFLWPMQPLSDIGRNSAERNAFSCVLEIQGAHHRALLLGDISHEQEQVIAPALDGRPYALVVVPHHGSRHGSSTLLTETVRPCFAAASAGWWNRFLHPHPETQQRWEQAGAMFLSTLQWGALSFASTDTRLHWHAERWHNRRYWHHRMSVSLAAAPRQSTLQCAF